MDNRLQATKSPEQRFWEKVNKDGPIPQHVPELGKCWEWTAGKCHFGHGAFHMRNPRRQVKAHRVSWVFKNGDIPSGLCVLHKCDNPPCVNPEHLFLGTQADNISDKCKKGRQPMGDSHSSRKHPEKLSRGKKHSEIMKRVAVRGDNHPARKRPEILKRGEDNKKSKLTTEQVLEIRRVADARSESTSSMASRLGVCHTTIRRIIRRDIWSHVG